MAEAAKTDEWEDLTGDGGILKKILVEGTGPTPEDGSNVTVHYVGTLTEGGKKFDSSRDRDDYFKFDIGQGRVIKGWDQGVATMKEGEKCILRCRSDYAYGDKGSPPTIPGGASLDFEVELFPAQLDAVEEVPGVLYKVLNKDKDEWRSIKDEADVTFDFAICDNCGEPSAKSMSGVSLQVNNEEIFADWPQWFHTCLQTMQLKMSKLFSVKDSSKLDIPAAWGVKSEPFFFRVDISTFTNPKDPYELSTDENVAAAGKRKEKGNVFFKAGKYEQAIKQYNKGCENLDHEINKKKPVPDSLTEAFHEGMHNLYVSLYANLAMAYLKQKQYSEGIEAAVKVLKYAPKHLKALCRQAQCLAQSGKYQEAQAVCETALAEDPNNATAKQIMKFAKGKISQEKRKMQKMASRMFGKSSKKSAKTEVGGGAKSAEPVKAENMETEEVPGIDLSAENPI